MKREVKKTVIRGVLEEELERNARMKSRYSAEIEKLPKGSVFKRRIGHQEYYYLKYRENGKSIAKYLGNKSVYDISDLQQKLKRRKHLENVIRDLKLEEKEIIKALK